MLNSIPKAGTHLLIRILSLVDVLSPRWKSHITRHTPSTCDQLSHIHRGQFISAHLMWREEYRSILQTNNIKTLFIIRDLRDLSVSKMFFSKKIGPKLGGRFYDYHKHIDSDEERLTAVIAGVDADSMPDGIRYISVGERARSFLPWMHAPGCLTVRFEDLIGHAGGGSDEQQLETVRAIIQHLGLTYSDEQITRIASQAFFQKAKTFRKGQIGDWSNHFTEEQKRIFKQVAGAELIEMGYADGYDW
ncbi:MAG: sulfotransferase domain-containing protein [Chloroflexaceae bacterium]|nr:sulfotransferase domain-containing protein [Chloroflexaceae bacterium]